MVRQESDSNVKVWRRPSLHLGQWRHLPRPPGSGPGQAGLGGSHQSGQGTGDDVRSLGTRGTAGTGQDGLGPEQHHGDLVQRRLPARAHQED